MAVTVAGEAGYWIIGSLLFPFGLALAMLGAEIITGSFALLPWRWPTVRRTPAFLVMLVNMVWSSGQSPGQRLVRGVVHGA
ncbi:MAG: hypothetical protein MRJ92_07380 [Nitrospira sp.]|nr:hypothetical protein [Nitrospira sp.]